jgi:transcriptional regulator of acetoin/glycerol metabolism
MFIALYKVILLYILKETSGKLNGPGGAAEILGMKRTTLYTRMKKLGLLS